MLLLPLVMEMSVDYAAIGMRIAKRRSQLGMKQNVLADKIGISNNYLSSIEHGKSNLSLEILIDICSILRITPDYLLLGNMYSKTVPQNIIDALQLCSAEDVMLLNAMVQHLVERNTETWNRTNCP